jgi:transposase
MGQTIQLTDTQWEQLDHLRMNTASADVFFRNCTIILMSAVDRSKASISKDMGCCTHVVARVRRLYRKGGVKALHPIKPPGRPSRANPEYISQMRQAIQTNPLTLGYGFSTLLAARLAEHLARVTGIRFNDDQLRRLLHQGDFSIHRPKHTLRGKRDEHAYERARKGLIRLKKSDKKQCRGGPGLSRRDGDSPASDIDADVGACRPTAGDCFSW